MICPECHGSGVRVPGVTGPGYPCLECSGSGILHCCEGDQCQPPPDTEPEEWERDPEVQRRIAEAFDNVLQRGPGEPSNWRKDIFGEDE